MRTLIIGALLFATCLHAIGCKPQRDHNELASLENLAAGAEINRNLCSSHPRSISNQLQRNFDIQLETKSPDAAELFREAAATVTAVPPAILQQFAEFGGKVIITDQPEKYCASANPSLNRLPKNALSSIEACYIAFASGIDQPQAVSNSILSPSLNVVVAANTGSIRHAMVRQFGYLTAQILMRAERQPGSGRRYVLTNYSPKDAQLRTDLALSFIRDVALSGIFKTSDLAPYLGSNVTSVLAAANLKNPLADSVFDQLSLQFADQSAPNSSSERTARLERFKDFVIAESIDSYYCNSWAAYDPAHLAEARKSANPGPLARVKNSRRLMSDLFPHTTNAFRPLAAQYSPSTGLSLLEGERPGTDDEFDIGPWDGTFSGLAASIATKVNQDFNPLYVVSKSTGDLATMAAPALVEDGQGELGKYAAAYGGFMTSVAGTSNDIAAGTAKVVADPRGAYSQYYNSTYDYTTRVIEDQRAQGSSSPALTGGTLASLHILGPGKITEAVNNRTFDGNPIGDLVDRIGYGSAGVAQTASWPLAMSGGLQFGNRLAFRSGVSDLATKPVSNLFTGKGSPVASDKLAAWGQPTAINPSTVKPWEWADEAAGKIRTNPTLKEIIPDSTGIPSNVDLKPGTYIYAFVENPKAPLGYSIRYGEEVAVGKSDNRVQGLGHPTILSDGARGLFGGDLTVAESGGLKVNNLSSRITGEGSKLFPERGSPAALQAAQRDFARATGRDVAVDIYDPINPRLPSGAFKSPNQGPTIQLPAAGNGGSQAVGVAAGAASGTKE